jgi:hypothetical protein
MRYLKGLFLIFLLCSASLAQADVPKSINIQGRAMTSNGVVVANGNYGVTVSIYNVATGGTALWADTTIQLAVNNGYFSSVLGSNPTFPLPGGIFNQPLFVGILWSGDSSEMTPRLALGNVPYSMQVPDNSLTYQKMVLNVPQVISGAEEVTDYSSGYFYVLLTTTPRAITFTLHLDSFPQEYYRELAPHTHSISGSGTTDNTTFSHTHNILVDPGYGGGAAGNSWGFAPNSNGNVWRGGWLDTTSQTHDHTFSFSTTSGESGANVGTVITTTYVAKTTLSNLKIILNGTDITSQVLSSAGATGPISGTMSLKANILSLSPNPWIYSGENTFQFSQSASGGGKVRYNLYVWY